MRKLLAVSLLSGFMLVGCGPDEATIKAYPEGGFVVHKLSKRRGQVTGYGIDDQVRVRFVHKTAVAGPNSIVIEQEAFEDVFVRPYEIEPADQPTNNQKGN